MVTQASHRILLGERLHRLPLPLPALDIAAFLLIEVDEFGHAHFIALGLDLRRNILSGSGASQDFLRLLACFFGGQNAIAANCYTTVPRQRLWHRFEVVI